jgi:hypothetical protein
MPRYLGELVDHLIVNDILIQCIEVPPPICYSAIETDSLESASKQPAALKPVSNEKSYIPRFKTVIT